MDLLFSVHGLREWVTGSGKDRHCKEIYVINNFYFYLLSKGLWVEMTLGAYKKKHES